jgi:hypothetical protein
VRLNQNLLGALYRDLSGVVVGLVSGSLANVWMLVGDEPEAKASKRNVWYVRHQKTNSST